MAVKYFEHRPK